MAALSIPSTRSNRSWWIQPSRKDRSAAMTVPAATASPCSHVPAHSRAPQPRLTDPSRHAGAQLIPGDQAHDIATLLRSNAIEDVLSGDLTRLQTHSPGN